MPRTKKYRRIQQAPDFSGFRPFGTQKTSTGKVMLHYEEYEAIKLCDYEKLNQTEASEMMSVSRPTFTRVYQSTRKKIAKAIVEGSTILIEGGRVIFNID